MHPLDAHLRVRLSRAFSQHAPREYPLHHGRSRAISSDLERPRRCRAASRRFVPHSGGLRLIPAYLRGHALHHCHVIDAPRSPTHALQFHDSQDPENLSLYAGHVIGHVLAAQTTRGTSECWRPKSEALSALASGGSR